MILRAAGWLDNCILEREKISRLGPPYQSCTVGGDVNWYNHYGEQYGGSLKIKNRTTIYSRKPTPYISLQKDKNSKSKRHMHPNVQSSTIYNSQGMDFHFHQEAF